MNADDDKNRIFRLPDDLAQAVGDFSERYGESPSDIVIAAVDHFARIPEQQRRAVLKGTSARRRT